LKGQAIAAFVTLEGGRVGSEELKQELRQHVVKRNRRSRATRRSAVYRRIAQNSFGKNNETTPEGNCRWKRRCGDVTTLEDVSVLEKLRQDEE